MRNLFGGIGRRIVDSNVFKREERGQIPRQQISRGIKFLLKNSERKYVIIMLFVSTA